MLFCAIGLGFSRLEFLHLFIPAYIKKKAQANGGTSPGDLLGTAKY